MIFSYEWLQSFFGKKLPSPEKLGEVLTLQSLEVEEIKKHPTTGETLLDIAVLANRAPDLSGHYGMARELAAVLGYKLTLQKVAPGKKALAKEVAVVIEAKKACPRYTALVMEDCQKGKTPAWMARRLNSCGVELIHPLVDVANYVMLETGQPLHVFDLGKIVGRKLSVRFAKEGEKLSALDDKTYPLTSTMLVIADEEGAVGIAGIKGGSRTGVGEQTTAIVIEGASFASAVIRRTSKALGLHTDASWRFERGLDPALTETATARAAELIREITGGRIAGSTTKLVGKKDKKRTIALSFSFVEKLLGATYSKKEIVGALVAIGCKVTATATSAKATVPSWRRDLIHAQDLVEEVARLVGLERIGPVAPVAPLAPVELPVRLQQTHRVREILKGRGFTEVYTSSFVSHKDLEAQGLSGVPYVIALENPLSEEQGYLRPSILPSVVKAGVANLRFAEEVAIFECGTAYRRSEQGEIREIPKLAGFLTSSDLREVKGVTESLVRELGFENISYAALDRKIPGLITERSAQVMLDGRVVGSVGELLLEKGRRASGFSLDIESLVEGIRETRYTKPSLYPASLRDLSIEVPSVVRFADIEHTVKEVGGALLSRLVFADLYNKGELQAAGKKSVTLSLVFQSSERTLTSSEVEGAMGKIASAVESRGWSIR